MRAGRSLRRRLLLAFTLVIVAVVTIPVAVSLAVNLGGASVVNTDGDGLNLRDSPSLSGTILTGMPEGAQVEVLETGFTGDDLDWAYLRYAGIEGYAAVTYLSNGNEPVAVPIVEPPIEQPPAEPAAPAAGLAVGDRAIISGTNGDGVNVRSGPGTGYEVVAGLTEGSNVPILGGPSPDADGANWFQVEAWGVTGWVHSDYLAEVGGAPVSGDAVGEAIAAEALKYLGAPYVWAGTNPNGFDCSGFTYFIMNWVLGNDFPRAIEDQLASGEYVHPNDLQPGDLVFFTDTYKPGLSHVGIYIGKGEFVNAGSEDDVVAISYMWDDYWGPRYLESRRIR
jgi:cell wall-associated NlpC family hydrolase